MAAVISESVNNTPARVGDTCYALSSKWLFRLRRAAAAGQEFNEPIDNRHLFEAAGGVAPDARAPQDYVVVGADAWELIEERFGGGPAIAIEALRGADGRAVADAHFVPFEVAVDGRAAEVSISALRTVGELRAKAVAALGAAGEFALANDARQLPDSARIWDSGLCAGQSLSLVRAAECQSTVLEQSAVLEQSCGGSAGLVGLSNSFENICYMNAVVQCLFQVRALWDVFSGCDAAKGALVSAFARLMRSVWEETGNAQWRCDELKETLKQRGIIKTGVQQDSHEFLMQFMEEMNKEYEQKSDEKSREINRIGDGANDAEVARHVWECYLGINELKLFKNVYCLVGKKFTCSKCGRCWTNFTPFSIFPLYTEVPGCDAKVLPLRETIRQFFTKEKIDVRKCDYCESDEVSSEYTMFTLPEVLIFQMSMFENKVKKNFNLEIPEKIDMKEYYGGEQETDANYSLVGFVKHMGSMLSGHYTSYVKHRDDGNWYCINDMVISKFDKSSLSSQQTPYLLFYERKH